MTTNIRELLTAEELARVTSKDDLRAACIVLFDWAMVIGLFVLAAAFPNPVTMLFTVLLLGGRQMAFGVLVHETGHKSFFTSQSVNDFVATWLSGYWVFSDKDAYMKGHLMHHKDCGTVDDPDLKNFDAYPVSSTSFKRKVLRDITGKIGWRRIVSIGRSLYRFNELKPGVKKMLAGGVICNLALLLALSVAGFAELYALWVIAFMTSHMLITRIRQIAEHAAVPDHFDPDIRLNTRTIYISWLEALLVAPHGLNFHLEHHLIASVPIYRLRELHQILLHKGYYEGIEFPKGYLGLLRRVTYAT
ncbi:MAG: fatty acid desaturase family protein [Gammaproteobacteria bacterium]|jgi:fatty acid desaturase|nr:fatty acid desaturase family protein [Gammaproteobacteria bacterium]MBT4616810.1 fatty acid desaturase family protein [Gammaproteobacteria bacterium]MBT5442544.1 fatty acid desaturase family protein [Gammaproteobacteria bacterium]MBT6572215.1 fatty acid desaturase family protein [Gammaproteobacteria bacterium]MBT6951247.1 fatty acid desaturase family protein [Gammaproteobacteria bacterium]